MEERTASYLQARFRDHYRHTDLTPPPGSRNREWGYIPWATGDTQMFRHISLLEYDSIDNLLVETSPRHAYFSAARYEAPSEENMEDKGWRGADLVFDLDADHLPEVDADDTVPERLEQCKQELLSLLDLLERDFGFEDPLIVFSGGRGYHVHIRSDRVFDLTDSERKDIANYVLGNGITYGDITRKPQSDKPKVNPDNTRVIAHEGGWGRRVHERLVDKCAELAAAERGEAEKTLQEYDGIGEAKSDGILSVIDDNLEEIKNGTHQPRGSFKQFVKRMRDEAVEKWSASIDEPVTKDVHRLIRVPGSIHGGTGLEVTRLDRSELDGFEPLSDAVPAEFRTGTITVRTTTDTTVEFDGDTHQIASGEEVELEEHLAVYLMCRGFAEKP